MATTRTRRYSTRHVITLVKVTLEPKSKSGYKITVNGVEEDFSYKTSRLLTQTHSASSNGIFTTDEDTIGSSDREMGTVVFFARGKAKVEVDLGSYWNPDPLGYENPALEIKRRIALVNAAFKAVEEANTTKVWTAVV